MIFLTVEGDVERSDALQLEAARLYREWVEYSVGRLRCPEHPCFETLIAVGGEPPGQFGVRTIKTCCEDFRKRIEAAVTAASSKA